MTETFTYDLDRFHFPAAMRAMLGVDDLTALDNPVEFSADWSIYKGMEQAPLYGLLVDALADARGAPFRSLYRAFIATEIRSRFAEPILYQACPTVRLLFANATGEPRYHRDRDYGHGEEEINFTVALTDMFATNAIWIESAEDAGDYKPITLAPGQYARFDGASLRHGARRNLTGASRVSFDFRVLPQSARSNQQLTDDPAVSAPDPHLFARCA